MAGGGGVMEEINSPSLIGLARTSAIGAEIG